MAEFKNIAGVDLSQLSLTNNFLDDFNIKIQRDMAEQNKMIEESWRRREAKEAEQKATLNRIVENTGATVDELKESNKILKQTNDLLNEKLSTMSRTLDNLFDFASEDADEQKELLKEANEIARQIEISIIQNGKFDWKSMIVNTSSSGFFMGLQVYLHSKGLL